MDIKKQGFLRPSGQQCKIHEHDIESDGGNSDEFPTAVLEFMKQFREKMNIQHGDLIIQNDTNRYRNYFDHVVC